MNTPTPSSFPFGSLRHVLAALLTIALLGGGNINAASQTVEATPTATPTSDFIGTVGGRTTHELPPSEAYDADGSGSLDMDELGTSIEERYPKMIWPDAYVVPVEEIIAGARENGRESWEIGSEFRLLEVPALCAWFQTYLDAYEEGDQLHQWAALDQAAYVLGGAHGLTDEEGFAAMDAIRYATLQDPAPIQAFLAEGPCANPWATPIASPAASAAGATRPGTCVA